MRGGRGRGAGVRGSVVGVEQRTGSPAGGATPRWRGGSDGSVLFPGGRGGGSTRGEWRGGRGGNSSTGRSHHSRTPKSTREDSSDGLRSSDEPSRKFVYIFFFLHILLTALL